MQFLVLVAILEKSSCKLIPTSATAVLYCVNELAAQDLSTQKRASGLAELVRSWPEGNALMVRPIRLQSSARSIHSFAIS